MNLLNYKQDKVAVPDKEMLLVKDQYLYEINGLDMGKSVVLYKKELEIFKPMPKGDYKIIYQENNQYIQVTNEDIFKDYYAIQVVSITKLISSMYEPQGDIDVNIVLHELNNVITDMHGIVDYIKKVNFVVDSTKSTNVFPDLPIGSTVIRLEDGTLGAIPISEMYEHFDRLTERIYDTVTGWLETDHQKFIQEMKEYKDELEKALKEFSDKLANDLQVLFNQKSEEFKQHIDDDLKPILLKYVNEVLKPELKSYAETLKVELNTYTTVTLFGKLDTKTIECINKIETKCNECISRLNTHTEDKKKELDARTEKLKGDLNTHSEVKKQEISTHAIEVKNNLVVEITKEGTKQKTEVIETGDKVKEEINGLIPDNLGIRVEQLEKDRVLKAGDTMTGTLNINMESKDKVVLKSKGVIDGVVGSDADGVIVGNSKSGNSIRLNNDGVGIYPSTSLKTEAKDLSEAVNELLDNKLDKGTYSGNASDLDTEISKIASTTQLGRIIVGDNLTINEDGILSGNPDVDISGKMDKVNTIAELKDMNLKVGDVVEVLGYYTKGDGADHKRKIESSDDGSGVLLSNGLYANIVHNGEVNVSWFGAVGDGVFKNGDTFIKASRYICSINGVLRIGNGSFLIDKTIDLTNMPNITNEKNFYFSKFEVVGEEFNQTNLRGDIGLEYIFKYENEQQVKRIKLKNLFISSVEEFDDLNKRAVLKGFKFINTPNSIYENITCLGITQLIETDKCWFSKFSNIRTSRTRRGVLVGSDGVRGIGQADFCEFSKMLLGGFTNEYGLRINGSNNIIIDGLDGEAGYTGPILDIIACRNVDVNNVYLESFARVQPIKISGNKELKIREDFSDGITISNVRAYNIEVGSLVVLNKGVMNLKFNFISNQNSNVSSLINLVAINSYIDIETESGFYYRNIIVNSGDEIKNITQNETTNLSHLFKINGGTFLKENKKYYSPFVDTGDTVFNSSMTEISRCIKGGHLTNKQIDGDITFASGSSIATMSNSNQIIPLSYITVNNQDFIVVEILDNGIRLNKKSNFSGSYPAKYTEAILKTIKANRTVASISDANSNIEEGGYVFLSSENKPLFKKGAYFYYSDGTKYGK